MGIRANQVQAVLIPVGVALISIAVLAWYGMYWIPANQRYLDERNVRLLRTIGTQIKVKVNNFDQAIDNAMESFDLGADRASLKGFPEYVELFTPELAIIDSSEIPKGLEFDDPPRVKVILDEGKHYLYLGYSHVVPEGGKYGKQVVARTDLEATVATYLSSHPEFDALALVDHDGRAIAQQSSSGVELARLDTVPTAVKGQGRDAATRIENVTIGGADYRFYVQPVLLSLLPETGDAPEEWKLCGLVRADHFRAASAEVSSTVWLLLLLTLASLLLAIPILKLHVLHPRGRYRGVDGVAVAVTSFMLAGLVTFTVLDVFYFGAVTTRETDGRLNVLAHDLNESFANEVNAASAELDTQVASLAEALRGKQVADTAPRRIRLLQGDTLGCTPQLACRTDVLLDSNATADGRYPYYKLVTWSDSGGWQRYKWTTSRTVTPFINNSALPYVDDARRAHRLAGVSAVPQRGVSVIRSPNTAEALTVVWRALPDSNSAGLLLASLVTTPVSVSHPVLPWGAQFAVVDPAGQVLYHSDGARSLNENFFQEAMDNGALRAAVLGHKNASLSAEYLGKAYRMHVQPVDLAQTRLADPRWSLVVFEQALIPETVNLEVLTVSLLMFVAYSLLLAFGWVVAHWSWPRAIDKWFWPDARRMLAYRRVTAVNAGLGLFFLLVVVHLSQTPLLAATVLIALAAIVATFRIVQYTEHDEKASTRARFHWFLLARASYLFVVSVVPAMAVFEVAQGYEAGLLDKRRSLHAESEMAARRKRIVSQQASLRLCPMRDGCLRAASFLTRRLNDTNDVHARASDDARNATTSEKSPPTFALASMLSMGHGAYNNVAIELQAAMPGNAAAVLHPNLAYPMFGVLLALVVVFIVRKIVWPLYALDLYRPPGFVTSVSYAQGGNLLLVGPAGSGKTDILLRRTPGTRVFDVGTLTFVDVSDVASAPARAALRPGTGDAGTALWVDALNASTLPENGVLAIDHFDYRMDDSRFRELMLPVLEHLVYTRHYTVWIATSMPPAELLRSDSPVDDADRWMRLFGEFRTQMVDIAGQISGPGAIDEESHVMTEAWSALSTECSEANSKGGKILRDESMCSPRLRLMAADLTRALPRNPAPSHEDILFEFGVAAESYYRALFAACSMDQKLALHQLAETGVVNPRNTAVIAQLLRNGLVRRDPTFRVMNETFRRFVAREMSQDSAVAWEHEGVRLPWGSVSTMMLTVALLPIGLMLLTQQQLLGVWVGALPTLTPMVPSVVKLISSVGGKKGTAVA